MITAQVKGIFTSEMDFLENHIPKDPENFSVVVRAMVGPRGTVGEESFDINVCTPEWLKDRIERDGFLIGTHHLFVESYDPAQIKNLITKFIERYSGNSWTEVAQRLSRIGQWEFEDYKLASADGPDDNS